MLPRFLIALAPAAMLLVTTFPMTHLRAAAVGAAATGPATAAAAATTPTAAGFAPAGIKGTERRDTVGLWCAKPMVNSSAEFFVKLGASK
jgi:hypothetical protein